MFLLKVMMANNDIMLIYFIFTPHSVEKLCISRYIFNMYDEI